MKHFKLNTIVIVCLLSVITLTSVMLFIVSVNDIKKFKSFALNETNTHINKISSLVFGIDIDQQTTLINQVFKNALNLSKLITVEIQESSNLNLKKRDYTKILSYDTDKKIYNNLNKKNIFLKNTVPYGAILAYWGDKEKGIPQYINNEISKLVYVNPLLREICKSNDIYASAWVVVTNKILAAYSEYPTKYYTNMNRKHILNLEKSLKLKFKKNQPIWTNVYENTFDSLIITLLYPYYDKNNNLAGIVGIDIYYNKLIDKLYSDRIKSYYDNNNIIRLFTSEKGNLISFPGKYDKLLSLPHSKNELGLNKSSFLNINLLSSSDPAIRKLAKDIIDGNSGEKKVLIQGKEYLLSFTTIPVNGWNMAVLASTNSLYNSLQRIKNEFNSVFMDIITHFIFNFIIVVIICLVVSYFIFKRNIVRPFEHLRSKIKLIGKGNFHLKFRTKGIKEIYDLAVTFNSLGVQLNNYTKRLEEEIVKRESVENSIKLARRIQEDILPSLNTKFDTAEFVLKAKLLSAKEVSGDFYDGFFLDKNKIAFLIADVSGKCFPAAFFMAIARTTIKNIALTEYNDPGLVLKKANEILSSENMSSMFVTIFLAYYEIATGKFVYANGGHHPAIKITKTGKIEEFGALNGPALGVIGNSEYSKQKTVLQPGSSVFIYTDGVIEAFSQKGEEYGKTRLIKYLNNNSSNETESIIDGLVNEVIEFQQGTLFDDITVCMLTRKP
ncbi:MAG TPA: SpoIIE family protein phosphatase [Victivallales bacterium]|nr:SpoIIE family protein phosphatase [Victivallales bacterium]